MVSFNNPSTFISTLNISGNTTLNNATTCISSLNVSGITILSGNVGIGTTTPIIQKLHVQAATPAMIRVETNNSNINQVSGIEFGIPAFPSNGSARILSTTISGDKADLQFYTPSTTNNALSRMTISPDGNIGIGTTSPNCHLHMHKLKLAVS